MFYAIKVSSEGRQIRHPGRTFSAILSVARAVGTNPLQRDWGHWAGKTRLYQAFVQTWPSNLIPRETPMAPLGLSRPNFAFSAAGLNVDRSIWIPGWRPDQIAVTHCDIWG